MTFRDCDGDDVRPEYLAGYVSYGNNVEVNPFTHVDVDEADWSEEAIKQRKTNERHHSWHRGNRDAKWDSNWSLR